MTEKGWQRPIYQKNLTFFELKAGENKDKCVWLTSTFDRKSLSLIMNLTVFRMLRQDEIVVPVLSGENAKCFLTKLKKKNEWAVTYQNPRAFKPLNTLPLTLKLRSRHFRKHLFAVTEIFKVDVGHSSFVLILLYPARAINRQSWKTPARSCIPLSQDRKYMKSY